MKNITLKRKRARLTGGWLTACDDRSPCETHLVLNVGAESLQHALAGELEGQEWIYSVYDSDLF